MFNSSLRCQPSMTFWTSALCSLAFLIFFTAEVRALQLPEESQSEVSFGLDFDGRDFADLNRRRNDICGVPMRTEAFQASCRDQDHYYHWDGTKDTVDKMSKTSGAGGGRPRSDLQCDHIVELQWLNNQIQGNEEAKAKCKDMKENKASHPEYKKFQRAMTGEENAIYVSSSINGLKGLYNNPKITEAKLAQRHPSQSRATGDYVGKTQGNAAKVMDKVYKVFPTLQPSDEKKAQKAKEAAASFKKLADPKAEKVMNQKSRMTRTFDVPIRQHSLQVIKDCDTSATSAENCDSHATKSGQKRPTTPSKALPEGPWNKAKVGTETISGGSATRAEGGIKKQGSAVAAKPASSSSAKSATQAENTKKQGSRCNPMKRSLCQYRPKAAATTGTHRNQRPTRSSWSAQRKAALSLPGLRKGPGAPRKTTSWPSKTHAEGHLWRSSPKPAHNTRPMRSSSRSKPVASFSRSRTASRSHSASSSRSPSHPTGSSPSPSRSSSTFRTQRSSAHGTKPMKSKLNSITIALRPSTKSSKGSKTPKLGSLPTSAKTGFSRAAKSGKVKGHKSH